MKILGIDLSNGYISFCLYNKNKCLPFNGETDLTQTPDLIEKHLKYNKVLINDLDFIAIGQGPGSYFGLKLSFGLVGGLGLGAKKHIITFCSVTAIAISFGKACLVCPNIYNKNKDIRIFYQFNDKYQIVQKQYYNLHDMYNLIIPIAKNELHWDVIYKYLCNLYYNSIPCPKYIE